METLDLTREHSWYHTLELAPGQVTEGVFDLRPYVHHYGLPARMDGMRVLDVGTFDGFWAFEMERRGADVVAIDVDWEGDMDWPVVRRPEKFSDVRRGETFDVAKEMLGSNVERHYLSIYDATPADIGSFDLVFCGSVLIHLRDQALAIERMAGLCHDRLVLTEVYSRRLNIFPFPVARYRALRKAAVVWWEPNIMAWEAMVRSAGFRQVRRHARFQMKARRGWSIPHVVLHAYK